MSLKERAKKFHDNDCYHKPINDCELVKFAETILNEFVEELKNNARTVVWNYGLDSVVFADKLDNIKEGFLNGTINSKKDGSDEDNSAITVGTRTDGRGTGDS